MQSFLTVLQQFLLVLKHWTDRSSEHLLTFTYSSLMSLYSSLFLSLPRSLWYLCSPGAARHQPDSQCCVHISLCLQEPALSCASTSLLLVPPAPARRELSHGSWPPVHADFKKTTVHSPGMKRNLGSCCHHFQAELIPGLSLEMAGRLPSSSSKQEPLQRPTRFL